LKIWSDSRGRIRIEKSHYSNRLETADIKAVTDDALIFAYYILRYTKEISWRSLFFYLKTKNILFLSIISLNKKK